MANNRIVLVCKICKVGITIAKYFPSSGWYPSQVKQGIERKLERFLERHEHDLKGKVGGMYGGYQFETRYEVPEDHEGPKDEWQFEPIKGKRKHE